jgi:hypothetical protein
MTESPFTFGQQVQAWRGQRWAADIELPPMRREKAEEWIAWALKLNGREGTFLFSNPFSREPQGIASGEPVVEGAAQSGSTLHTSGWAPYTADALKPGDMIQLGSGATSRLHKVLDPVEVDEFGEADLLLWPALRESPVDQSEIVTYDARGVFRLASNELVADISRYHLYGVGFTAVEAV